jgi:two-component system sensor histidine kinase KdpD
VKGGYGVPPTRQETREEADLLSALAHDLRSPLTAIRGAAALLLQAHRELAPEKVAELLAVIESQAGRMADKVEDILVTYRLEEGRLRLFLEDFDVADSIADVLDAARSRAGERRVRVTGVVEGLPVRADRDRMGQVLRSLLDNAVRHTPAGRPVEIRAARANGMVRVEVRDRGTGISPADRDRIFERMAKLDDATPGQGLGLYVARGLARAMGGDVGVDPRPGGGSVFWVTVPAATK